MTAQNTNFCDTDAVLHRVNKMGRARKWTGKSLVRAEKVMVTLGIDGRPFCARDFIGVWMDFPSSKDCPIPAEVHRFFARHPAVIRVVHGNQVGVKKSGKFNLYGIDELWLDEQLEC